MLRAYRNCTLLFLGVKSPANCDAHLAESLFQTRSSAAHPNSSEMHCKMRDILGGHKVPGNSPMPCVRQSVYYAL